MTYQELIKRLSAFLPTTYGRWATGQVPELPYIVLMEQASDDIMADNRNYHAVRTFNVELYFLRKNPSIEGQLEAFFESQKLPFSIMADQYIPSEKFFERIYTIELGGNIHG